MHYLISIGSNEWREANMQQARESLKALFADIRFATEEETSPIDCPRQTPFTNQIADFTSDYPVTVIVSLLKELEQHAGRTEAEKKQGIIRLDIDVLACDDICYKPQEWQRDYIKRQVNELTRNSKTQKLNNLIT
ncbi:MAG: 2-amino-4-hydroxy-6-hydroxymethyldihydropteridine diphosphokinase [Mediterranea sp.]|jgi:2-amino-4-hydroxy-6-hydroxymethyldihydropteridine diphosphokinase|nr:2-amino-4-hydroxy-6-hydroxymethyldihydropteridine diphosphokinase [Mediterranea sp.]